MVVVKVPGLPGNRLIFASTGPVNRDYDDIRRFSDAASNGIKRSAMAGIFLSSSLPFRASHLCFKSCFFHFFDFQGPESWNAAATVGLPSTQGL